MSITSTPVGTPPAEHAIDARLVRRLLAEQHPDLVSLPLQGVDGGWDNALFRLGDRLVVRLPRRTVAADLIVHEQRWRSHLAGQLTLPNPRADARRHARLRLPLALERSALAAGRCCGRAPTHARL